MKKIAIVLAGVALSCVTSAATVGWTHAGMSAYANDAYSVFVIGQKGVESIATITALLDAGNDVSSYAFGSGKVGTNGAANQLATAANAPVLGEGTYTEFMVLFDSDTPSAGSSKYVVVSGVGNQTQIVGPSTAKITFGAGNVATQGFLDASNWKSFGPVTPTPPTPTPGGIPEPTSGLLLLVGGAMLALRRKQK